MCGKLPLSPAIATEPVTKQPSSAKTRRDLATSGTERHTLDFTLVPMRVPPKIQHRETGGNGLMRAFIFPGQGSQLVGMGQALAEAFPAARHLFDEVDDALSQTLSAV